MPYAPHPAISTPNDPDTVIWRYVGLAQFIDMLDRQALRFTQLARLEDPFEGVPADVIVDEDRALRDHFRTRLVDRGMDAKTIERWGPGPSFETPRTLTFVNCWHMNNYESQAMWRLYGRDGIAIRSTVGRLKDSIRDVPELVQIGEVIYRDRRDPASAEPIDNILHPAVRKGMSYAHERELRAIVLDVPSSGIYIEPVDLDALIDNVYVAPGCPEWIKELVERILSNYKLGRSPVTSDLESRPDLT